MAQSARRVTCIFCGLRKPGSREHVIPRWVRDCFNIQSEVTIEVAAVQVRRWPNLYVKLDRMVCADCNNGWMSDLEQKVRPFLGPMLVNQHSVDLDTDQQRDLARWAIVKTSLLELSIRQQHPGRRTKLGYTPSGPELAWLHANPDPPPRSRVWLGAFDAQGEITVSTMSMQFSTPGASGETGPLPSHVTTMTVGYVLLQAFTIDYVLADAHAVPQFQSAPPPHLAAALPRIWPAGQPVVHWPPNPYVDQASLDRVRRWT